MDFVRSPAASELFAAFAFASATAAQGRLIIDSAPSLLAGPGHRGQLVGPQRRWPLAGTCWAPISPLRPSSSQPKTRTMIR
jgi:hypothetical protein